MFNPVSESTVGLQTARMAVAEVVAFLWIQPEAPVKLPSANDDKVVTGDESEYPEITKSGSFNVSAPRSTDGSLADVRGSLSSRAHPPPCRGCIRPHSTLISKMLLRYTLGREVPTMRKPVGSARCILLAQGRQEVTFPNACITDGITNTKGPALHRNIGQFLPRRLGFRVSPKSSHILPPRLSVIAMNPPTSTHHGPITCSALPIKQLRLLAPRLVSTSPTPKIRLVISILWAIPLIRALFTD